MNKKVFKKASIASLVMAMVIVLSLIFIVKYRIKSIIQEVVRQETKGFYELDFSKITIDFFNGMVKLNAVDLKPASIDTSKKNYQLTVGHLYFSLASWNQLLFHRKLFVDSLRINDPDITIFQRLVQKNKNGLAPIQEIFRSLEDISEIFKLHVLEINRGRIEVHTKTNALPLVIKNINFRVENFGQKQKENNHLRYADNVTLNIGKQYWSFPTGQTIQLGSLYFSGKDQMFQVDSCAITTAPNSRGQRTALYAEKFLFRIDEIVSLFDKNELNLDTLYCKSPVLSVAIPAGTKDTDTVSDLNESIHQLPVNINIKFINIENGQIKLTSSDNKRTYTGKKTNLKIYRLNVGHNPDPVIRAGKIDLNLHEISFATRDSLYLLTVNEFRFDSNNLVCSNAFLKPSLKAKGYLKGINLPAFTLIDISLNDLLEKRLKALVAVIDKPQFFFSSRVGKKKAIEYGIPVGKFYSTLKGLAQLIDVHWLTIKDGTLDYTPRGSPSPELSLKNIDVEINLEGMLNSSSLQETRQTIQSLRIGSINLVKDKISAGLNNFFINGSREIGTLGSLVVQLSAGIRFNAANLYWQGFSWEDFVRNKSIHIDTLNIPSLGFWARSTQGGPLNKTGGLHPLAINKLNIGQALIDIKTVTNAEIKATASHVALDQLHTAGNFFYWQKLSARADSIFFKDDKRQLAIQQLHVQTQGESLIRHFEYSDGMNRVKVPQTKFQLQANNSDRKQWMFPFLSVYQPEITIKSSKEDKTPATPINERSFNFFPIGKLDIFDGSLHYTKTGTRLNLFTRFNAHILSARVEKSSHALVTDRFSLQVDSLAIDKPMQHGSIAIRNLCGGITDYPLIFYPGTENTHLKSLINNVHVTDGQLSYTDSAVIASVSKITGNGNEGTLSFRNVTINPQKSLETFLKTSIWQKDYLTFHCDGISLQQINNHAFINDSALAIGHVYLQNPHLSTYRNKNIAFQHGIEKLMPTKLIANMKVPVRIDSVQITGGAIDVHEVSAITKRKSILPISGLNGTLTNLVSRPNEQDSLILEASARVLDYKLRTVRYAESYQDSLSGFNMQYGISPMQLKHLTQVTDPATAIAVIRGQSDTLYANLSGNKYASSGQMNFYYRDLKVRLLDKEDSLKKSLLLSLETLLANGLIKSKNQKPARMFFIRDREKFVFNYWVKTLFSGFVTSAGVKSNKKYKKMYKEADEKYSLPLFTPDLLLLHTER
ncbi:hypothetical protein [Niastella yeongjuensis]|nr:hypothetical protein [Niastella yeongjuensis]